MEAAYDAWIQVTEAKDADEIDLTGKTAIVVEDEGLTQLQLQRILVHAGLRVLGSAVSGPEGVELALRERPDLILIDIKMKGEYDGLEAARRILAEIPACIVILTAYADHEREAREIGATGYVIKPVDRLTLLPQLKRAYANFCRSVDDERMAKQN